MRERLERCLRGDRAAFSELVELFEGSLLAFAHHLAGDPGEAEDLAQATFVEAFRSIDRLRDADRFGAWLRGICRNLHRRRRRERARRPDLVDTERLTERKAVEPGASAAAAWAGGLSAGELFEVVSAELEALPEPARLVLTLRHYRGLSCKEIARRLDLPIGTVTMRLSRAQQRKLRETLARQLHLERGDTP